VVKGEHDAVANFRQPDCGVIGGLKFMAERGRESSQESLFRGFNRTAIQQDHRGALSGSAQHEFTEQPRFADAADAMQEKKERVVSLNQVGENREFSIAAHKRASGSIGNDAGNALIHEATRYFSESLQQVSRS
jgi:hypothetical protein